MISTKTGEGVRSEGLKFEILVAFGKLGIQF